ncbi:MAG: alanine--tRNA ligase [Candidatus Woesearchaeota archaeon]
MLSDKEVKRELRRAASMEPEKYYAVDFLKGQGFSRHQCSRCGKFFWSVEDSDVCGDPACSGGFRFIGDTPAKRRLSYVEVWAEFSRFFSERGYSPIKRYPVAARWRDDTDFVQASIYDFQPFVVSGEVEPPANPLVVPQFCLRFNDVDNVGITGAHYTGFVMIGQHAFTSSEGFDQERYFRDIFEWLTLGLGIPKAELKFHEDAWAGGGNAGPCMEYFCRGLELGNQVYMRYQVTEGGLKPLRLNVLDMGMGHERNAWFTNATSTSYEAVFPEVMKYLYDRTGFRTDQALMRRFLPYASYLNADEVEDIEAVWADIADKLGVSKDELKDKISRSAALYSIAEHARSLLFAISDGVLPSNVAGGYNLRMLLRRALSLIERYGWDVSLAEVCRIHAEELKPLFPELSEGLDDVEKILNYEREKYLESRRNAKRIVEGLASKRITAELLVQLYDSHGISPDFVRQELGARGISVDVPENFYSLLSERHSVGVQKTSTKKGVPLDLSGLPQTEALYFGDYTLTKFSARVLRIIDGKYVVLDRTAFYPTSGGQLHDTGRLGSSKVLECFKDGGIIVHLVDSPRFREGELVEGVVDFERRLQLAQHHTSAHIVNAAARIVLGRHVWQAGASKSLEHARLDITHYKLLERQEVARIEEEANRIVQADIPVRKFFLPRAEAERRYGFSIYQGGAVPGRELRIVEIPGVDVEACGGTHLNRTGEVRSIRILRTSKVQDGIIRIEFVSGRAAEVLSSEENRIISELSEILNCEREQIPGRVGELFDWWKRIVKKGEDKLKFKLSSEERLKASNAQIISAAAERLKTQPEHLVKTVKRFLEEIKKS